MIILLCKSYKEKNKKSIYYKMIASVLRTFLIILIFMEFAYIWTITVEKRRTEEASKAILDLHTNYWNVKFETITGAMATQMFSEKNNYYTDIIKRENELDFLVAQKMMIGKMQSLVQASGQPFGMFLYIPDTDVFLSVNLDIEDSIQRSKLTRQIKTMCGDGTYTHGQQWYRIGGEGYTYLGKTLTDQNGYVGVLIKGEKLKADLMDSLEEESQVFIVDSHNQNFFDEDPLSENFLRAEKSLGYSNYYLAMGNSDYKLYTQIFWMIGLMVLVTGAGVWAVYLTIRYQITIFLKPLIQLKTVMEDFGRGDLKARIKDQCDTDEMNAVYHAFNEMAGQVEALKLDIYEQKMANQEINFNYLRLQIKPHFYTNILSLIHGLAEIKDYEGILGLSKNVAAYFRYLMNSRTKFISLNQELKCIENYIEIQKIRYPGHIHYRLQRNVNTAELLILPMTLLTLVENSIKHNITFVDYIEINIKIDLTDQWLCMIVSDNGQGFDPEVLARLLRNEDISVNGEHIGLINLKKRMIQIYGEEFKLNVKNLDPGAVVYIKIPTQRFGKAFEDIKKLGEGSNQE